MLQQSITAAPFNLFDTIPSWTGAEGVRCRDKPRQASAEEVREYLLWLQRRSGLFPFESVTLHMPDRTRDQARGATFGRETAPRDYQTGTPAQYERGSYSIPMPGNGQSNAVTFETLGESGEVVSASTMPIEPRKGGVIWKANVVRRAVGKVAKRSTSPRPKTKKAPEPLPAPSPGVAELAAAVRDLTERLAKLEATPYRADDRAGTVNPAPTAEQHCRANDPVRLPPDPRARAVSASRAEGRDIAERAKRVRIARRYLAMRAERAALRAALGKMTDKRRRATIIARDLQKRLNAEYREVDAGMQRQRQLAAQVAALKARPHHLGNEVRPDDVARLTASRDAERKRADGLTGRVEQLTSAFDSLSRQTDALADRALAAENALRAVKEREARGVAPFKMAKVAVTWAAAA